MTYKVTALQDLTIRAMVLKQTPLKGRGAQGQTPKEFPRWVSMKAGETRTDITRVLGVDPELMPGSPTTIINGMRMVPTVQGWTDADLPKEFQGLYRLETMKR